MSDLIALNSYPLPLVLSIAGVLGLILGSFFNVVIWRLPRMLELQWQASSDPKEQTTAARYNLAWPNSHCPACETPIRPYDNLPLLSFMLLKGRCRHCKTPIHWQYPVIEFVSAAAPVLCLWHFGIGMEAFAYTLLLWFLLILTAIDLRHFLLPDALTLPLIWLGLLGATTVLELTPSQAIWGAVFGYLALWLVYWAFKLLTGKEGMGYGDFKLLAAVGAWLGPSMLPLVILLASFSGALVGLILVAFKRHQRGAPLPFGPFISLAAVIALFLGPSIYQTYWQWAGLA